MHEIYGTQRVEVVIVLFLYTVADHSSFQIPIQDCRGLSDTPPDTLLLVDSPQHYMSPSACQDALCSRHLYILPGSRGNAPCTTSYVNSLTLPHSRSRSTFFGQGKGKGETARKHSCKEQDAIQSSATTYHILAISYTHIYPIHTNGTASYHQRESVCPSPFL